MTILSFILAARTIICLVIKEDKITIFYLVFVAFTEELAFRDIYVYLLKNFSQKIRYLLPSIAFAEMDIFR